MVLVQDEMIELSQAISMPTRLLSLLLIPVIAAMRPARCNARATAGRSEIEHADDVGMRQSACRFRFFLELNDFC